MRPIVQLEAVGRIGRNSKHVSTTVFISPCKITERKSTAQRLQFILFVFILTIIILRIIHFYAAISGAKNTLACV